MELLMARVTFSEGQVKEEPLTLLESAVTNLGQPKVVLRSEVLPTTGTHKNLFGSSARALIT